MTFCNMTRWKREFFSGLVKNDYLSFLHTGFHSLQKGSAEFLRVSAVSSDRLGLIKRLTVERHGVFKGDLSVPALTPAGVASLTPPSLQCPQDLFSYLFISLKGSPFFSALRPASRTHFSSCFWWDCGAACICWVNGEHTREGPVQSPDL